MMGPAIASTTANVGYGSLGPLKHVFASNNGLSRSQKAMDNEEQIQLALSALQNSECSSVNAAATQFNVSRSTLQRRVSGGKSQSQAAATRQNLTNAEKTLAHWISRYALTGHPVTHALVVEMAKRFVFDASDTRQRLSTPTYIQTNRPRMDLSLLESVPTFKDSYYASIGFGKISRGYA
jgi:hypothetical protein